MRLIFLSLLILIACDFETPVNNQLVNFNEPVNFFDLNKVSTTILRFPSGVNYTDTLNWSIDNGMFQIELKSETTSQDSNFYISQISYDVFMETDDFFAFTGVDSVVPVFDAEIVNTNPHYDDVDRLEVRIAQLQYKTVDDENFKVVTSIDSLLAIDLDMKLRYYFRVASGYSYPWGEIPQATFFLNEASYRIRCQVLGFYLE